MNMNCCCIKRYQLKAKLEYAYMYISHVERNNLTGEYTQFLRLMTKPASWGSAKENVRVQRILGKGTNI